MAAVSRVAVIGGGVIGSSWASLFLARGLAVNVYDPAPAASDAVLAYIRQVWPMLESLGVTLTDQHSAIENKLTFCQSAVHAVSDAEFIQEKRAGKTGCQTYAFCRY